MFSYNGKTSDTLASLRHAKFMEALSLQPQILPPTERPIYFHALRVHLQVAQWKLLDLKCLNQVDWGWRQKNDGLVPIKTDIESAPSNLLQFIRCNCKTTSRNTCGSRSCSCLRSGLKCVSACGDCRGELSENSVMVDDVDIEDDMGRNIFDIFEEL